jgi:hypothetical protein
MSNVLASVVQGYPLRVILADVRCMILEALPDVTACPEIDISPEGKPLSKSNKYVNLRLSYRYD